MEPKTLPEAPKSLPEPPPATTSQVPKPARSNDANRTASFSRKSKKSDPIAAPLIRPLPTRNDAVADYLKLDVDASPAKPAGDKPLELQADAASGAKPVGKDVSGPELRD